MLCEIYLSKTVKIKKKKPPWNIKFYMSHSTHPHEE